MSSGSYRSDRIRSLCCDIKHGRFVLIILTIDSNYPDILLAEPGFKTPLKRSESCLETDESLVPVRLSACGSFQNSLTTHTNERLKTRRPSGGLEHCALVPLMNVFFRRLDAFPTISPFPSVQKKSSGREQDASAGLFSSFTRGRFGSHAFADPTRCMMGKLHSAADLVTPVSNERK
ncbi:hypothetical protein QQF64_003282 [Cirrhinus molitorella]|uniref:Uncharacterized protein n=2 Tax=Cirrhinus molitorella TaxID=172907 RepID=A0AA88PAV2_9TELE|nr:hypothetical protein Q8A67_021910 [Cirrhinus molitorella]